MSMSSQVMRSWTDSMQHMCALQERAHHVHLCQAGEDGHDLTNQKVKPYILIHACSKQNDVDATGE